MKKIKSGFTLSELLLAAAILVFVLAGLLALFANCLILNDANRNLIVATSHAQYIMEEIKNAAEPDFAQLESGDWDLDESQIQSAPYNLTALSNETIDTNVTQQDNDPDLLIVSVIVQWNDRGQRPRSAQLETLIANYQ